MRVLIGVGAYAEYIAVSVDMLMKKPGNMKWEEAAGIPEVSPSLPGGTTSKYTDDCRPG